MRRSWLNPCTQSVTIHSLLTNGITTPLNYKIIKANNVVFSITAFDNLELLVEQIDNASNLDVLKLWPPLIYMLTSSPEPQLRRYAAWVIGTAVQNNPKAQSQLLKYQGIKKLVEKLKDDEYSVRTKILYALGSELTHFPEGMKQFSEAGGWGILRR